MSREASDSGSGRAEGALSPGSSHKCTQLPCFDICSCLDGPEIKGLEDREHGEGWIAQSHRSHAALQEAGQCWDPEGSSTGPRGCWEMLAGSWEVLGGYWDNAGIMLGRCLEYTGKILGDVGRIQG